MKEWFDDQLSRFEPLPLEDDTGELSLGGDL